MSAILGIDAAWTPHNPSGVALIRQTGLGLWECVRTEPSYWKFIDPTGNSISPTADVRVPVAELLRVARQVAGTDVVLVAADIPLANEAITGRRFADDEVSRLFGARGCSTHSPDIQRPGKVSEEIRLGFRSHGFRFATNSYGPSEPALIETFPHPALLSLVRSDKRVRYKICKTRSYWPGLSVSDRLAEVSAILESIVAALNKQFSGISLPRFDDAKTFAALKPIEDMIDALVCAWVGTLILKGQATPLGNKNAAIWVPTDSLRKEDALAALTHGDFASESFMGEVEDLPVQERCF